MFIVTFSDFEHCKHELKQVALICNGNIFETSKCCNRILCQLYYFKDGKTFHII